MKTKRLYWELRGHWSNLLFRIRQRLNLPDPVDFAYLDLIFENCNWIRIPSRLVEHIYVDGIKKRIWTNFCQQYVCSNYCDHFYALIKIEALKIETAFQKSHDCDFHSSFEHHLKVYKDITHIEVKPTKGKKWYIAVPYDDKNGSYINKYQATKFEDEWFTIEIKKCR